MAEHEFVFKSNLRSLYLDMKKVQKERESFSFEINHVVFDVIFLIDRSPFELLVGVRGHNLAFTLFVRKGFATSVSSQVYAEICRILQLNYADDHFSSFRFLQELDRQSPHRCTANSVEPHQIARFKKNVPESEKIYFCGWNDHQKDGRKAQNFEKTEKWLGKEVADYCRKNNISSMWTDDPNGRVKYQKPF